MVFNDLREYIDKVKEIGECQVVEGADWDQEIGAITAWQADAGKSPLLLFDKVKGYHPGYRIATNLFNTSKRISLAMGLSKEAQGMELVKAWREKLKGEPKFIAPVEVDSGPIKENVHIGDDVDVYEIPTPKQFPPAVKVNADVLKMVKEKWSGIIKPI